MTDGHADTYVPEVSPDGLRHWQVATGVLFNAEGELLLVENRRKNNEADWSTPGGVVDPGENSVEGLTREVLEETGIAVQSWTEAVYRVEVTAPGFGFFLEVDAYLAIEFSGSVEVDDPDQIVISADFVQTSMAQSLLRDAPRWVGEPLLAYLKNEFDGCRTFSYDLEGTTRADQSVTLRP